MSFHAEFGFNQSEITKLLENEEFSAAEELIENTYTSSCLNEGFLERFPLYIVLCGYNDKKLPLTINFYLASKLIRKGANVNHRTPIFKYSEFTGFSKSALELLIENYNKLSTEDIPTPNVIGLGNHLLCNVKDILRDILDLVHLMIIHGCSLDVLNSSGLCPLHVLITNSEDTRLFKLLCENGANINIQSDDCYTPLMYLCDSKTRFLFKNNTSSLSYQHTDGSYSINRNNKLTEKQFELLKYCLSIPDIQPNMSNNDRHTALIMRIFSADWRSVRELLIHADHFKSEDFYIVRISPFKALMCSLDAVKSFDDILYPSLNDITINNFSFLIDEGLFDKESENELTSHAEKIEFPTEFLGGLSKAFRLMFGGTSSTILQLCTRNILKHVLLNKTYRPNFEENYDFDDQIEYRKENRVFSSNLLFCLSEYFPTSDIIKELNLPKNITYNMQLECIRLQIMLKFRDECRWYHDVANCLSNSDVSDSDHDSSLNSEGDAF